MNVLVVGGGGREHALVRTLARSSGVKRVICSPGNGGIEEDAVRVPIRETDTAELAALCGRENVEFVVIGPEQPLTLGLADVLRSRGVKVFGPGTEGARLEGSKIYAKEFMDRHGIHTAAFRVAASATSAREAVNRFGFPCVIKYDGLAAGKGVVVAASADEANAFIARVFDERAFGANPGVVVEECLAGRELSWIVFTDTMAQMPMAPARDYKRALDGNRGPNTGGMGCVSSDDLVDQPLRKVIEDDIVLRTLRGLASDGIEYRGALYFGLMITAAGPRVLEYNVRFGDPETQAILPRLRSDFGEIATAVAEGRLKDVVPAWTTDAAVCVVLASGGYPGRYETGKEITGIERVRDASVFQAGTARDGGRLVTSGGRVLGVTALGPTVAAARERAYRAAEEIQFDGKYCRGDIAA